MIKFMLPGESHLHFLIMIMNRIFFVIALLFPLIAFSQPLAFPDAQGFGKHTTGGRGGNIYKVTNTNSSGTGSWPWALSQPAPRVIIFKTGGVFTGHPTIGSNTTVFGQTAPGDGFAIWGACNQATGNNVIIRGMRFFCGNDDRNGVILSASQDVIVDHSSVAWAGNETISIWNSSESFARRITLSNNVFFEGLSHESGCCASTHPKHCEGHCSQNSSGDEITHFRNMCVNTSTNGRAPKFARSTRAESINYLVKATNSNAAKVHPISSGSDNRVVTYVHFIGSIYKSGGKLRIIDKGVGYLPGSRIYIKDMSIPLDYANPKSNTLKQSSSPVFVSPTDSSAILPRGQLEASMLPDVGPYPRDQYVARAISDYKNNTNRKLCAARVSKPSFSKGTSPTDTDNDGIPDAWEDDNGLNKNSSSDARQTSPNGYMWIEEWANSIFGSTPPGPDPQPEIPDAIPWLRIHS